MILTVDVIRTTRTDMDPAGRPGPVHGRVIVWRDATTDHRREWELAWEWPLRRTSLETDGRN